MKGLAQAEEISRPSEKKPFLVVVADDPKPLRGRGNRLFESRVKLEPRPLELSGQPFRGVQVTEFKATVPEHLALLCRHLAEEPTRVGFLPVPELRSHVQPRQANSADIEIALVPLKPRGSADKAPHRRKCPSFQDNPAVAHFQAIDKPGFASQHSEPVGLRNVS